MGTVLITGGAGGIGTAIATELLEGGHRVVSLDRTRSPIATRSLIVDVVDETEVTVAVREAADAFGGIDGLVCAAGTVTESPVVQMSLAQWRLVRSEEHTSELQSRF